MAVCVVCLLCAEHLPCHQHLDAAAALGAIGSTAPPSFGPTPDGGRSRTGEAATPPISIAAQRYVNTLHLPNEWRDAGAPETTPQSRAKRHSHAHGGEADEHGHQHQHGQQRTLPAQSFVQKLFERFGNATGDGQTMNVVGFERMLNKLGLYELLHGGGGTASEGSGGGTPTSGGDGAARAQVGFSVQFRLQKYLFHIFFSSGYETIL